MAIELERDRDELGAMALGEQPFRESPFYERLARLPPHELMNLPPGVRLSLGYYCAAQRRAERVKEVVE